MDKKGCWLAINVPVQHQCKPLSLDNLRLENSLKVLLVYQNVSFRTFKVWNQGLTVKICHALMQSTARSESSNWIR